MSVMNCSGCGEIVSTTAKRCMHCGRKITGPEVLAALMEGIEDGTPKTPTVLRANMVAVVVLFVLPAVFIVALYSGATGISGFRGNFGASFVGGAFFGLLLGLPVAIFVWGGGQVAGRMQGGRRNLPYDLSDDDD